jgi:hypothetical protein
MPIANLPVLAQSANPTHTQSPPPTDSDSWAGGGLGRGSESGPSIPHRIVMHPRLISPRQSRKRPANLERRNPQYDRPK